MPHCSTKYSPYYLVLVREMRLLVEYDWKPLADTNNAEEDSYEEHVKALAERLREASKVTGRYSKTSHETAKRYHDR